MAHVFVSTNLGESFMSIMEQPLDLTHIVDTEVGLVAGLSSLHTGPHCPLDALAQSRLHPQVKPNTPVLMCSVPGYDASGHVEDLAAEQNTQITSIAIGKGGDGQGHDHNRELGGSPPSSRLGPRADSASGPRLSRRLQPSRQGDQHGGEVGQVGLLCLLSRRPAPGGQQGTERGSRPACRWVMLKNVHLAPGWLMQLEKKLHSLQPHACFRLFLTMEINPKVGAGATPVGCGHRSHGAQHTRAVTGPFLSGAREPAASWPHLRVRAAPGGEGQHAEDVQQHPRRADLQGEAQGRPSPR